MDKLEKYIQDRREEFEPLEPGNDIWDKISEDLDKGNTHQGFIKSWIWKAASVVLLLTVIGLLLERQYRHVKEVVLNQQEGQSIDFSQVEDYYNSQISLKRAEIQGYLQSDPSFHKEFTSDIVHLDSLYSNLKKELTYNKNQKIIDAMIVNLQVRIEILNQQLNILKKIKNSKENEKTSI